MVVFAQRLRRSRLASGSNPNRFARFDAARALAAYAVIWIHTPRSEALTWSTILCRFAVPFFTAGAAYFAVRSAWHSPDRSWPAYARARVQRIYGPFVVWSLIYLAFKYLKWRLLPEQENDFPGVEILWTGGAYHLWFMPFILLVCLASHAVARRFQQASPQERNQAAWGWLAGAVALSTLAECAGTNGSAWVFMLRAAPAAFFGLELAFRPTPPSPQTIDRNGRFPSPWWSVGLGIVCLVTLVITGRNVLVESLAGAALLRATLGAGRGDSGPFEILLVELGRLSAGIYFAHLLVIKILESGAARLQFDSSWQLDLGIFIFAAVCSTLLAWLLSQFSLTRSLAT